MKATLIAKGKTVAAAAVAAVALAAPSTASASYNLTKRQAERYVTAAAEARYGDRYGVEVNPGDSFCRPQNKHPRDYSHTARRRRFPARAHRWTCSWAGTSPRNG